MRTCNVCGCYLPDKWNTCPACHATNGNVIRNNHKESNFTVFKVNVMNNHEIIAKELFGRYEDARIYALRKLKDADVSHTEIVSDGMILNHFYK